MFGTVSIPAILAAAPGMAGSTIGFAGMRVDTMTLLCLLLFVGAMGKSAQLGAPHLAARRDGGPDPGQRADPRRDDGHRRRVHGLPPVADVRDQRRPRCTVVTYVGAATCIFAATVGCAQNDIKRVIAYSTCSQLGYMFFAAGVGAYGAAMFHLFTHAFFKALLFLGAGSVIHAMHHEQDMRYYGALRKEIPITFWVMVIGTLAITGVGIDAAGSASPASGRRTRSSRAPGRAARSPGTIAFWLGALAALLTSFYRWRLIFLTFFGKPRWAASEHIQHALHGEHDAPDEEHGDSAHDAGMPADGHRRLSSARKPADDPGADRACWRSARCSPASSSTASSSIPSSAPDFWRGSDRLQPRISPMPRDETRRCGSSSRRRSSC